MFKVKHESNGRVERFKRCLVAKGWTQKYGIDYDETLLPVVRFSSIQTLLALAVQNDMLIHQTDVITTFLNGTLDEEAYMQQPDGYVECGKKHLVCKLIEITVWLKTVPLLLEQSVSRAHEVNGIQTECNRPLRLCPGRRNDSNCCSVRG